MPHPRRRDPGLELVDAPGVLGDVLLEGGFLFSRALRTTAPLLTAGRAAVAAVRAALADGAASRPSST